IRWMAAGRERLRERAGYWGDGRDAIAQLARKAKRHHRAVRDPRRVDARGIDPMEGGQMVDQRSDESDVVDVRFLGLDRVGFTSVVPGRSDPVRINRDESVGVRDEIEPGVAAHLAAGAASAMEYDHEWHARRARRDPLGDVDEIASLLAFVRERLRARTS